MRFYFTMLLIACSLLTRAQDTLTKDGKLMIEFVDTAKGLSKDQIYSKVKAWFGANHLTSNTDIQTDDKENGRIIGTGTMKIYFSKGAYQGNHTNDYVIDITIRDGKYRLQLYDFKHDGQLRAEVIAMMMKDNPKSKTNYDSYFFYTRINSQSIENELLKTVLKVDDF
jgi:hypothetical protein